MSFIKLTAGGKERSLKFNQFASQEMSLNYTRHPKLATDNPELFFLYNIIYSGIVGGYKVTGEEIDFTFFDVINWVDDLYEQRQDKEIQNVIAVFKESRLWEDIVDATTKKKEVVKGKQAPKKLKRIGVIT
jgi:hypothetical protein